MRRGRILGAGAAIAVLAAGSSQCVAQGAPAVSVVATPAAMPAEVVPVAIAPPATVAPSIIVSPEAIAPTAPGDVVPITQPSSNGFRAELTRAMAIEGETGDAAALRRRLTPEQRLELRRHLLNAIKSAYGDRNASMREP